ncbi:adenosine deaminase [Poseidonocella sedimentorum]|uniref:Adenosine deaminase n=1 Tax=Poseidonocella sedimentorum TaxID=871652 RepID=A0A1I6E8Q1_9RHOB|nr:adenosine deaminase [Poseidonocella sedimentorum]SFR14037.1 adenosine deaminase [Poseidonocella sedimentorum]
MSYRDVPKIELHLHIEGAAPPGFIRGLAQEKSVNLTGVFDEAGHYTYRTFNEFLSVYEAATEVLKSPRDYARLTTAVLEECAANGVVYAETFISPDFCGGGDLAAWREYLHAMQEAAEAAERAMGITLRGIVTCVRHFGPDKAKASARCAAETAGNWITGFGMGGDEMMGHQGDFAYAFDMAREAGLRLTTHAGEWGGPASMREAIRDLRVERIGHGVQAISDASLIDELIEKNIVLEVCPGSNVALGVVPSFAAHPIAKLREAGVRVTISTDDPPFFHTTMTREYDELERAFGWGEEDFAALNRIALDAAFCDDDTRARIAKHWDPS